MNVQRSDRSFDSTDGNENLIVVERVLFAVAFNHSSINVEIESSSLESFEVNDDLYRQRRTLFPVERTNPIATFNHSGDKDGNLRLALILPFEDNSDETRSTNTISSGHFVYCPRPLLLHISLHLS